MANDTEIQKLKSEYPEFFEQFSAELLEFIFSEETSSKIAKICFEKGVEDEEKIEKIAYRVALALLNQVPKENLTEILEKGVNLSPEAAENVSTVIKQQIFSQIPGSKSEEPSPPPKPGVTPPPPKVKPEMEPRKTSGRDAYREPVE